MGQPTVFISYSHKDEAEKDQLVSHLGVLQRAGLLEVWVDDQIEAGGDWAADIDQAISQAKVAILLITRHFLNSEFILNEEVPSLLARRQEEGMVVFPIIARPCAWQAVSWLAKLNVKPKNGAPVWRERGDYADEELAAIASEVNKLIKKAQVEAEIKAQPVQTTTISGPLVHIHNWGARPASFPTAEVLDWNQPGLFEDGSPRRAPAPQVWQETLLPQLEALPAKLGSPERVRLEGKCALSTGFAFGQVFKAINRCTVEVAQFFPGRGLEWWSSGAQLSKGQPAPQLTAQIFQGNPAAGDSVVIINALTQIPLAKIVADVGTYFDDVNGFSQLLTGQSAPQKVKGVLVLEAGTVAEKRLMSGGEAVALAGNSRLPLIDFITQTQPHKLHLFLAVPLGLAVFLGHCWNRVGKKAQCYEWVGDERVYAPTCEVMLS